MSMLLLTLNVKRKHNSQAFHSLCKMYNVVSPTPLKLVFNNVLSCVIIFRKTSLCRVVRRLSKPFLTLRGLRT